MSGLNILIVGASIAGPTAAFWLSKAGANITIIERFPNIRKGGQNVDIRTIGVTVMNRMGDMEAQVRAHRFPVDGLSLVDSNDATPIGTMTTTGDTQQQGLISEYEILRGDLNRILYDLTKDSPRIKYVFNEQVTALHHHNDSSNGPITATFANGYPTTSYDLIIAADGSTSRTRAIGLDCGVRDHISSLNCWTAFFTLDKDVLHGSKVVLASTAPGGKMTLLGPGPKLGQQNGGFFRSYPRNQHDATRDFRTARDAGDDEVLKQYVAKEFLGGGKWSDEVLRGMLACDEMYATEWVQVKIPRLFKGRFTLVGDAGYAAGPTGNGTSLALGGAYILAGELARCGGDVQSALEMYEQRMRPLITEMQVISPVLPWMAPQTEWGIWVRNLLFRAVCWAMRLSIGGWLAWAGSGLSAAFGGDKWSDSLPEYEWLY